MDLESYRINNNLTYSQLSDHLGLKKSTVFNICKGHSRVSLENANKITDKTHGTVTIEALLSMQEVQI